MGVLWLRSAFFALVLPGSVLIWIPLWLSTAADGRFELGGFRWLGLLPLIVGAAGLLWCIGDFARIGRGTLAPVDPPRFVVRGGLFRFVRNPMYVSVLTVLIGEVVLFRSFRLAVWAAIVAVVVHLFVVAYEEPSLRDRFGADYETYCRDVPRWIPRAHAARDPLGRQ